MSPIPYVTIDPWADEVIVGELSECNDCRRLVTDVCQHCADEWRRRDLRWKRLRKGAA